LDDANGPVIGLVKIPKGGDWITSKATLSAFKPGVHHLFVSLKENANVEVDWVRFQ
jgi:hypothetical protein